MPGVHKYPTISFRISDNQRKEIEAKIKVSGMQKKDYFVRSCIYNKVCVVGKKENIFPLVEELHNMQINMERMYGRIQSNDFSVADKDMEIVAEDYLNLLEAVIWMLDGAKYLWQGTEKSPDSGNC